MLQRDLVNLYQNIYNHVEPEIKELMRTDILRIMRDLSDKSYSTRHRKAKALFIQEILNEIQEAG